MRPPNVTRPPELGGDGGLGKAAKHCDTKNSAKEQPVQPASRLVGVDSFTALLRASTPVELLTRVALHRRYRPELPLPEALQRAIGRAWAHL